ncbi:MAG: M48 family metalloprotease [Planctomycetota bacterium]
MKSKACIAAVACAFAGLTVSCSNQNRRRTGPDGDYVYEGGVTVYTGDEIRTDGPRIPDYTPPSDGSPAPSGRGDANAGGTTNAGGTQGGTTATPGGSSDGGGSPKGGTVASRPTERTAPQRDETMDHLLQSRNAKRGAGLKIELKLSDFTDEDERVIGEATARSVLQQYRLVDPESPIGRYVRQVGALVAQHSTRKDIPYRFAVLDSNLVNAFSAPAGYVFVTTGALRFMQSEAELAFVIGHEIAHIEGKHGLLLIGSFLSRADAMKRHTRSRLEALDDKPVLAGIRDLQKISDALSNAAAAARHSDDEHESDARAVAMLKKVGYDPSAGIDFFARMKAQGGETSKTELFRSHPLFGDRITRVQRLSRGAGGERLADRYVKTTRAIR